MLMYNVKHKYVFYLVRIGQLVNLVFNHKKLKVQSDLTFKNFEN